MDCPASAHRRADDPARTRRTPFRVAAWRWTNLVKRAEDS
jgi:hypothetical protein